MANNIQTGNFDGDAVTVATTDTAGVHTPHHRDPETIAALALILAKIITAPSTEAKQDTQITSLASILTSVDGVETLLAATNALLTTQAGYLDGVETAIASTNTAIASTNTLLTTQNGYLDGVEALLAAATPAGENHLGSVGGNTSYIDVTLSLDTNVYATGDVMADTQVVTNAMRANDATGILQSIQVLDEDDQGIAFDLVFLSANNALGTENSAVSISDLNARDILGVISVASADFIDIGNSRVATKTSVGMVVKPATGSRSLYVGAISRGSGTYSAAGVKLRLGFLQD